MIFGDENASLSLELQRKRESVGYIVGIVGIDYPLVHRRKEEIIFGLLCVEWKEGPRRL